MLSLDHVVFPVRDAEASLKFYSEVLGLPLRGGLQRRRLGRLSLADDDLRPGPRQELVCVALKGAPAPDYRGVPVDARHYALAAESAADLDHGTQAARGRPSTSGRRTTASRHSIYFPDPDGVILEITWPASTRAPRRTSPARSRWRVRRWAQRPASRLDPSAAARQSGGHEHPPGGLGRARARPGLEDRASRRWLTRLVAAPGNPGHGGAGRAARPVKATDVDGAGRPWPARSPPTWW